MQEIPDISEEWMEWYLLTPEQRWLESAKLWQTYRLLGGTLEPEPDMDSPFFDEATWSAVPTDGRSGVRVLRRGGV